MLPSNPEPVDHIGKRAKESGPMNSELTVQEAKEQLRYDLRDQRGPITYHKNPNESEDHHGDGTVIAKVGGVEIDHYIYHNDSKNNTVQ